MALDMSAPHTLPDVALATPGAPAVDAPGVDPNAALYAKAAGAGPFAKPTRTRSTLSEKIRKKSR